MTSSNLNELRLSVVMPAYNEESVIEAAVRDVQDFIFSVEPAAELIVIDDGSRDRTGAILDQLAREDARLRILHPPNGGHGLALRQGLDEATGEFVLLIDSDRQVKLESFKALWPQATSFDAVFGVRRHRHDPLARLVLTVIVRLAIVLLFGVWIYDANVPFKIVRRAAWLYARPLIPAGTLAPSLFLAIYLRGAGYRVLQADIEHAARTAGVSTLRYGKLIRFCMQAFVQLFRFRRTRPKWDRHLPS